MASVTSWAQRCLVGQVRQDALAGAGERCGDGDLPQPEPFGFPGRASCPGRASICVQVVSSQGATITHQIWFWVKSCRGRFGGSSISSVGYPVPGAGDGGGAEAPGLCQIRPRSWPGHGPQSVSAPSTAPATTPTQDRWPRMDSVSNTPPA